MTGYLHIPTDGLESAASSWLAERFGFSPEGCDFAAADLISFLRGLSVEPTDEAVIRADERQQLAARLYRVIDAIHGSPAHRLRMAPGTALDGIEWAADYLHNVGPVAAPVPVQEDRP